MTPGEWVGRHAGGCLIDLPHLEPPLPVPPGRPWRWIATLWPDPYSDDGWAAHEWHPAERGWYLPGALTVGDIIEVGLTWPRPGTALMPAARWYGWLQRITHDAVICIGGYPHPVDAFADARPVIDELRLEQLDLFPEPVE